MPTVVPKQKPPTRDGGVGGSKDPSGKEEIDDMLDRFNKAQKDEEDSDDDDAEDDEDEDNPQKRRKKRRKPFVDLPSFNSVVGLLICLNALTIGLETDARSELGAGEEVSGLWYLLEAVFCLLFMTELGLRLYFHKLAYFTTSTGRGWNIIDFAIVSVSILDTFILMPIGLGGSARFVSMLRFVRLMRLVRLVRLFRIFKELWLVANGLLNVMKTLMWICFLIFVVCYICAVFCTQWIGHNDELYDQYFMESGGWDHERYFGTVMTSVFTLLQFVTLDQWSDNIARHVIKKQPGMLIFFVLFICFTSFCLLNIIVGVVVENAISTASKDESKMRKSKDKDRQMVFNQLRDIFEEADTDGSGTLNLEEVEAAISKPEIYNKLRMIEFPVDDPRQIFVLLDYDDSGELTIEEFITGCMRMKGSAKSKDLLVAQTALNTMKSYYNQFEKELFEFEVKLSRLDVTVRAIVEHGEHVFLDIRQYRMRHPTEQGGEIPRMDTKQLFEAPWEKPEEPMPEQRRSSTAAMQIAMHGKRSMDEIEVPPEDNGRRPSLLDKMPAFFRANSALGTFAAGVLGRPAASSNAPNQQRQALPPIPDGDEYDGNGQLAVRDGGGQLAVRR